MVHNMLKTLLLIAITLPVLLLVAGQLGFLQGQRPTDLGATHGRLKGLSMTPNCVSSQAYLYPDHPQRAYAAIEPLPLKEGSASASMAALSKVLQTLPGVTVVDQTPDYIYVQAQTRWLRFTDDVEFWVNPAKQIIDVRSASRLGRKDFSANRNRLEAVRTAYLNS
jgi:uncharacterized protein (DUF1499 family)